MQLYGTGVLATLYVPAFACPFPWLSVVSIVVLSCYGRASRVAGVAW